MIVRSINNEDAMLNFGALLAKVCSPGIIIFLKGNLGVGKTTLTRGFLRGLDYEGHVKSPTYTLVEPYDVGKLRIYHFDLYRLTDPFELEVMGIRDYFDGQSICLVEWPENGENFLPKPDIICNIDYQDDGRTLKLVSESPLGDTILKHL